jgi:aminodeoxyfutalosine synthase
MLDNIPHLKVFWIDRAEAAEIALSFGADDVDGTVAEERITHAAGARYAGVAHIEELHHLITGAGRTRQSGNAL